MGMKTSSRKDRRVPVNSQACLERLSRKRRETIRPALENPKDFVLLSARALGQRLGIDAATVVRIVQTMGFPAYRDFRSYLHDLSVARATSLDTMNTSVPRDGSISALIQDSVDQDLKNLNTLRHSIGFEDIAGLAPKFHRASRILIFAGDLAGVLASYLEYQLAILGLPVMSATSWGRIVHLVKTVNKKDLVIAISFRKGLRQTVEGLQQAHDKGAYCVGITDTYVSPLARLSDKLFLTSIEAPPFGASYIAPMALLNGILVACANYRRARTLSLLRAADEEERHGGRWFQT